MIVLAYLWPLAIAPFVVERKDAEVRWHASHGLALMVAEFFLLAAVSLITSVVTIVAFHAGLALSLAFVILLASIAIAHVVAIVKGLHGRRLGFLLVTGLVDRWTARSD